MRSRPLGPGLGGLYYSPLLRDTNTSRPTPVSRHLSPDSAPTMRPSSLWQAIADSARRAAQRLVDARMAQARQQVNLAIRRYHLEPVAGGRVAPVKYY